MGWRSNYKHKIGNRSRIIFCNGNGSRKRLHCISIDNCNTEYHHTEREHSRSCAAYLHNNYDHADRIIDYTRSNL